MRGTGEVATPVAMGAGVHYGTGGDTSAPWLLAPSVAGLTLSQIVGLGRTYRRELKELTAGRNRSRGAYWEAAKAHGVYGRDGKLLKPGDMEPAPAEGFSHRIKSTVPETERVAVLKDLAYRGRLTPDLKASLRDAEHQYATSRKSMDDVNQKMDELYRAEERLVDHGKSHTPMVVGLGAGVGTMSGVGTSLLSQYVKNRAQQNTPAALGDGTSEQDERTERQSAPTAPISATLPATDRGERIAPGFYRKGKPDPNSREAVLAANAAKAKRDAADRLATKQDKPIVSDSGGTKTPPPVKSEIPWGKIGLGVAGVGAAALLAAYLYNHFNKPKKKDDEEEG
jgi:hypothetical protein